MDLWRVWVSAVRQSVWVILHACTERKPSTKSDVGYIRINPCSFGSRCLPNRSQNAVDSLPCRRQSFRRLSWKSAGDSMRNANKSPIPQRRGKWKSDPESVIRIGSPPNVNQFFRLHGRPYRNTKFQWNRLITFTVMLHMTEWRTDRPHLIA